MQIAVYLVSLVVLVLLQGKIRVSWGPDLILVFVLALSVKRGKIEALGYSFFAGLLQDLAMSFGFINTLVKTVCGILSSFLKNFITLEPGAMCFVFALILTPFAAAAASYVNGTHLPMIQIIISSVLNALLCPLFYSFLDRFIPDEK